MYKINTQQKWCEELGFNSDRIIVITNYVCVCMKFKGDYVPKQSDFVSSKKNSNLMISMVQKRLSTLKILILIAL